MDITVTTTTTSKAKRSISTATAMTTQYDHIGASFNKLRTHPAARLIDHNLQAAVAPYIKDASVLDLACGTGIFSNALLSWGASQVLGIDISGAMVKAAQASITSDNIRFEVGDCSVPKIFEHGGYDLVVAAWLLNYASSKEEMTKMYQTIVMNLKDDGVFVGVTPHPTNDPRGHVEKTAEARPVQRGEVAVLPTDNVDDGIGTHLIFTSDTGNVEFDAYHLTKNTYELAAREAGLKGTLLWKSIKLPDKEVNNQEFWETFLSLPHFGILVISKN